MPLHARVRVNAILSAVTLRIQRDVWRRVTDLHGGLRRGHNHGRRGHGSHRSLHRRGRRHGSGLPGDGAVRRLAAVVHRGVHGRVDGLPGRGLRGGQGAHGGIEVAVGLLGGGRKAALPPWYPAELPGDKERDPKQGQAAGRHHQ